MSDSLTYSADKGVKKTSTFCIHILANDREKLLQTLQRISRQQSVLVEVVVYSLQPINDLPSHKNIVRISQVTYKIESEIPTHFQHVAASYHAFIEAGTEYAEACFEAVGKIFSRFPEVHWLCGINLYKNNNRLLPPEPLSRRRFTQDVSAIDHSAVFFDSFLLEKTQLSKVAFNAALPIFPQLWQCFSAYEKVYPTSLYVAYSDVKSPVVKTPFNWKRWFLEKNIPYLRYVYYKWTKLSPVVRFDHSLNVFYLSEY